MALTDQATRLLQAGDWAGAERIAQQAVAALQGTGQTYEAYAEYDLGLALAQLERCDEALAHLDRSQELQGHRKEIDQARRLCKKAKGKKESRSTAYDDAVRILVTGAAGFIGSNFVHYWLGQHPDDSVVALDLLTYAGNRANLEGADVPFVQADIADLDIVENVLREHEIEVVVNFAAESHNSLAVVDPSLFARTNVLGTQLLLEAARKVEVERFHHISTCEVYGDLPLDSDEAFTEDSPYQPRTPYNASKAAADHYVRAYRETYGLATTITNCSNNYGPYQFPEKVIPLFVTNALDDRPLPMYASTQNRREWLHVRDHCRAIELVLEPGSAGRDVQRRLGCRGVDRGDRRPRPRAHREARVAEDDRPRPARPRPPLPAGRVEDRARARLAARRSASKTVCATRSSGTRRTAPGGSRSGSASRSKKPPGANSPVRCQTPDMSTVRDAHETGAIAAMFATKRSWSEQRPCPASDTGHVWLETGQAGAEAFAPVG